MSSLDLAAIVDSSDDAIISKTIDGVITSWNRGAERIFGWTAAEAVGRPITLIVPEDRHGEEDEVLERIRGGETIDHFETERVTKDGRVVNVSLTVSLLKDATGRIVGVSKIARDITVRRSLEDERNRLAAIIDSSDDAIVSKSLDGVIRSWNRGAERIFGWTAAEAIGRHITLIIPEDRRSEEDEVLARVRRGEMVDHFETVRVAKDGRLLTIALTVSPVRDATGRIVGASKVARDITTPRVIEDERDRFAAIIESSDDAIVSKSLDGIIRSWNRGAERIFGWTAAEAIGRHITLIIPEERRAEEDNVLARIGRGEMIDHFETVRVAKDGRLLSISLTVSPVKDRTGRIVGASKIARDVTHRRRLEDERDQLLGRERKAREDAEAASRTKDHLLATVSHELRTPLNSILGWARMLQSGALAESARARALDVIVRSGSALSQLVEDLLDLSRFATGQMRLTFETCDVTRLVDEALDAVRPAASVKGVALTTDFAPDVGRIAGAPDRLRQAVWNVVMNAIKFTPSGGHVDVTVKPAGRSVIIIVADDGIGIGPDILPYIFDAFRQEDDSSSRAHGGLGLGLALVKHLVELHGGHVEAESPGKGKGATFTLTFPRPG